MVLRGKHKGRVSLGFYRSQETAKKWQKRLAGKGFATEVLTVQRTKRHYWLDLSLKPGQTRPERIQELRDSLPPSASLKPVACSHLVAGR